MILKDAKRIIQDARNKSYQWYINYGMSKIRSAVAVVLRSKSVTERDRATADEIALRLRRGY